MPDPLLTYRGAVYPWHCVVGHRNVMWYVGKFDEATWQFFNTVGLSPSYLRGSKRGMAAVASASASACEAPWPQISIGQGYKP